MITSAFGRIFLDAYNKKHGADYSAKTFFVERFHPLFFDYNKYLMWITNSPFVQMKKGQKVETLNREERNEKLNELINKIENGAMDASVALGYAASEEKEFASTSGQVTSLKMGISIEDVYLSWIGAGLAVGVKGGLSILFDNPEVLLHIYEGWSLYRQILNSNPSLKGNQISSWNGLWIAHRYGKTFNPQKPIAAFEYLENKNGELTIRLNTWTQVLSSIAKVFQEPKMLGYVYGFGQMNTTIGFIPFALNPIRRVYDLYQQLFNAKDLSHAEELFGTATSFKVSCQQGSIGIKALEPKGLAKYVKDGVIPKNKDLETINFHTYITWILAMLNNQELWDKALTIASALKAFSESGEKGRTDRQNKTKEVLSATSKRAFIEKLTDVVKSMEDTSVIYEAAQTVNVMPTENVPYFLTLIRFQFATLK